MEEDTPVDQPPLFSKNKFTSKVSKKPTPVLENPQPNEALEVEKSCDPESYTLSFSDLHLADWATRTCKELGMKKPTQVQHHCIPRILAGQDVLGLAQTGSRHTNWQSSSGHLEHPCTYDVLLLLRDGYDQSSTSFDATPTCCDRHQGGKRPLEQNPDFPSVFSKTKFPVLDDADRVLDVGFEKELSAILQYLPKDRQTLLFSATMTENLQTLLEVSAKKAYFYEQYEGFKTVESLKQQYVFVPKNVKDVYLLYILSKMDMGVRSAIIFVSTCRSCHLLSLLLEELEQPAVGLHSHKSQALRLSALHRFKSGQTPILLAADVASRGLDIPTVDLVINYDIPRYARDYIHRVGRTARAGRGGLAVSFVTQNDVDLIHGGEAFVGKQLDKFECKENDVLADITKVYKAKRIATMKMMDDGFEQKAEERKAQKLKTLSEKGLSKEKANNKKRRRTKTTSAEESK
ncbi:hypothetical protein C5167_024137 [Papaver somniferum]|uniref:RNA helicase n=1 Tax=Papaver somniferum TaxID=3469 RepID=A0A4Y7JQX5_PAPSO|nr:hypothetical protein C5167_024137 [Papaver somniferum]